MMISDEAREVLSYMSGKIDLMQNEIENLPMKKIKMFLLGSICTLAFMTAGTIVYHLITSAKGM